MSQLRQDSESGLWPLLLRAASGDPRDREAFVNRFERSVRAYLEFRWRSSPLREDLDDAVQEVFLECFRDGGVLERIRDEPPDCFPGFLRGVTRNVALRNESRLSARIARVETTPAIVSSAPCEEPSVSRTLDRAWARQVLRAAGELQEKRAHAMDERARRRVEILQLRHVDGLPIRKIAKAWEMDPAHLHREYARAREEFRDALRDVVRDQLPNRTAAEVDRSCRELLDLLKG